MQQSKKSSPFFSQRGNTAHDSIPYLQKALLAWNFELVGEITQREANNLHAVINTTEMGIYYWNRTTVEIIHQIKKLQDQGVSCFYTMDAGPQVKILVMPEHVEKVKKALTQIVDVKEIIDTGVGFGSNISDQHLF
jgi:diphosphomevalonate decarboxylase